MDLVDVFLSHYRKLGVDRVMVMDFGSTDGTRDVLAAAEWREFVTMVPFPGVASLDSSNAMLSMAQQSHRSDQWCLFCDPDELLVTPPMSIDDLLGSVERDAELMPLPRFNVTAPFSTVCTVEQRLSALDVLTLRIARGQARSIGQDVRKDVLDPPWIFTALPGKVMVRAQTAVSVGEGDHTALTSHQKTVDAPTGTYLMHYPFRGYSIFRDKVERARIAFASNPHLSESYGWHLRRWIKLLHSGRLCEEYLQQFIADDRIERLLDDGTIVRDDNVRRFHNK